MSSLKKSELILSAKLEKCRRNFWYYCKTIAPDFYRDGREYLKRICDEMQEFYESDEHVLVINLPPRHGKSRTATLFTQWLFGKNNLLKIVTGSYNETLSTTFSVSVRDKIKEIKAGDRIVYSDIFPNTFVKAGDSAKGMWALGESEVKSYLATSPNGTATGFGADLLIVDDVIKSGLEACNDMVLESHWAWYTNTMLSRLQGMRKVILIMTRWASKDLAGRALEHYEEIGEHVRLITMKACTDGIMLCDDVLNKSQYDSLAKTIGENIVEANYNQNPIDLKGKLYGEFLEYDILPTDICKINSYTDTADQGADYLASIIFAVDSKKKIYILDIIYAQDGMDVTEKLVAEATIKYKVNHAIIESNNGGLGFCRNVKRIALEMGWRSTAFKPFHQSANKVSRILTGSTGVMGNIYFPIGWKEKWSSVYKSLNSYQREGKNKHDDIEDALTGVYESTEKAITSWKF